MFFDTRFYKTLISCFETNILDGIWYFPLYWTVQTDTSNSFQLFSNALRNKGRNNIIHVPYGSIHIRREHKNSSHKTFINTIRCYGTKHEKPHRVTLTLMDEAWNLRWCFHVCEVENTWYRENSYEIDIWLIERIKITLQSWFVFSFTR